MEEKAPTTPPTYKKSAFNCPFCGAYARMIWGKARAHNSFANNAWNVAGVDFANCTHCDQESIWVDESLIYPASMLVELPSPDLPEEVAADYIEAARIFAYSPRGSAALLRLAIEKLCNSLVSGRGDLNAKIAGLVKAGLNPRVQQALDIVRVIGNEAVHPGQINLNDSPETAQRLFRLVNVIARQMITEPNEINALFDSLPQTARDGIARRDTEE